MSEQQKPEDKDATHSVGNSGPSTPSDRGPSPSEVEHPTYFGRYRVEKLFAVGGFGAVYRAWDDELNRTVAIKLVRSERISESSQKSFLDEARVVAGLNHPNIVTAFDIGRTEQGDYFFVSRFVDGADLNKRMQQHAISQRHAVEIVADIADALNHAHSQGLVHRDVKPANILIDSKGCAYLTDFGIALQEHSYLLAGQKLAGTPEYMSPEQLRGESHRVDHRSDIYSLGLVLYRLLTGRGPFRYQSIDELIEKVSSGEVRTPRVFNAGIDVELERICLRALARKPNDRYTVALDFAEDLRWLLTSSSNEELTDRSSRTPLSNRASRIQTPEFTLENSGASDGGTIELGANVIPKGVRAFDESDAEFFLRLLPGPFDRQGVPDGLRNWIARFSSRSENLPMAHAIYGSSGSGKSSLIRAGVIPRLEPHVRCVVVDATSTGIENAILGQVRTRFPDLQASTLCDALREIRQNHVRFLRGEKLLIVVDQFEQWLDKVDNPNDEWFTEAIRQCDGRNIQAVFLVRDDFWIPLNRFFRELEIPLVDGVNCDFVDLFSKGHAKKVLGLFGIAFGKLDANESNWTPENLAFLNQAVVALSEDGKVVPVKLALFADTMKSRDWTPEALDDIGGVEGVGLVFLMEAFSSKYSKPEYRQHEEAAQKVLSQLLPPKGRDIKGVFKSQAELLNASGYSDRPEEFESLLNILDRRLRLISASTAGYVEPSDTSGNRSNYQLTHDYLVPSIREWLTRNKRSTLRGRAELILDECTRYWSEKRDEKQLPSLFETFTIYSNVPSASWTSDQSDMMRASGRYHGSHALILFTYFFALATFGWILRQNSVRHEQLDRAQQRVRQVFTIDPENIEELVNDPVWTPGVINTYIKPIYSDSKSLKSVGSKGRLHAEMLAVKHDPSRVDSLKNEYLSSTDVVYLNPLIYVLGPYAQSLRPEMEALVKDPLADARKRLHAAIFLIQQPGSTPPQDWSQKDMESLAKELLKTNAEDQPAIRKLLAPISNQLLPAIEVLFSDPNQDTTIHVAAANAVKDFAKDDRGRIAELIATSNPSQYAILFPLISDEPTQAVFNQLTSIVADTSFSPDSDLKETIRKGKRLATAAISLIRLTQYTRISPVFNTTDFPEALSQFVHLAKTEGVTGSQVLACLEANNYFHDNTNALYACLSLLGDYSIEEFPDVQKRQLVDRISELYQRHPESKIHGITRWLLISWSKQYIVDSFESITIPYALDRQWFQLAIDLPGLDENGAAGTKKRFSYTFVVFPPGKYQLGSTDLLDPDRQQDETQYVADITYPFAVLDREITFEEIIRFNREPFAQEMIKFQATPKDSAFFTTWFDSVAFCRWLGQQVDLKEIDQAYSDPESLPESQVQRDPTTKWAPLNWPIDIAKPGFRLPMESEWEISARGDSKSRFSFGGDTALLRHYGWYELNSGRHAHNPRELRPNLRGIYDSQGNVFEWCHGWAREDRPVVETDPVGPPMGASRVDRGGGWYYGANQCRMSFQYGDDPSLRGHNLGFRIALTLDPSWIERSEEQAKLLTPTAPLPPTAK